MGEKENMPFQLTFNGFLKVDFQGSRVTSDGGLILIRELDERLGLGKLIDERETYLARMTEAGFEVVHRKRFSRLGTLGWLVSGRLLRKRHLSPRQMIWFDRLLPIAKLLDHVLPVPGLSLIVVGRKPQKQSLRKAA